MGDSPKPRQHKDAEKTPTRPASFADAVLSKGSSRYNVFGALAECAEDMIDLDISKKNEDGSKAIKPKVMKGLGNPVYRELAVINGKINRMDNKQLRNNLKSLNLDQTGTREVQKNRLKAFYKAQKLKEAQKEDPKIELQYFFDYYVIIDFEATCEAGNSKKYKHEIIEFPAMLVDANKKEIIAEFQSYVRPVVNPQLSRFCTHLTGISQTKVNTSPLFPEVLQKFEKWMEDHNLFETPEKFAVVTDGPWDMGRFMFQQCKISKLPFPKWCREWVNIRKTYSNFYNTRRICLKDMLSTLQMKFVGRPHCGRDDAYNIARIAVRLLKDGANMRPNEELNPAVFRESKYVPWDDIVRSIPAKRFNKPRKSLLTTQENGDGNGEKEFNSADVFNGSENNTSEDNTSENTELPSYTHSKVSRETKTAVVVDCSNTTEFPELMSMRLKA